LPIALRDVDAAEIPLFDQSVDGFEAELVQRVGRRLQRVDLVG
jgi:hypothetical protein